MGEKIKDCSNITIILTSNSIIVGIGFRVIARCKKQEPNIIH